MRFKVVVEASATIANFGPGFDTFGLCLEKPIDVLEIEVVDEKGIHLNISNSGFEVPSEIGINTASVAAGALLEMIKSAPDDIGLRMSLKKGIKPGSGLGSSAASAVAGALGVSALLEFSDKKQMLMSAARGEAAASGAPHLDNVSPCLFGGFTAILGHEKLQILCINPPEMRIVVCLPEITVKTVEARKLIPAEIPLSTTLSHIGWASGIIYGMATGDIDLIAMCLSDEIAVPARKKLITGFEEVERVAYDSGALSFSIGGSGPAVYSFAKEGHEEIGRAMVKAFSDAGIKSEFFIARPGSGAQIVRSE